MPIEVISVLEEKIDALIETVLKVRKSNESLTREIEEKDLTISSLEDEKQQLSATIDSLKGESGESQQKLEAATSKIQSIIARLEAAE